MSQPEDTRTHFERMFEELQKQARSADRVDRERLELFDSLTRHAGWKVYQELLAGRIQLFGDLVMSPAKSVDGCVALEYVKGTMSGLIIARDLPELTLAALKASLPPGEEIEDDPDSV